MADETMAQYLDREIEGYKALLAERFEQIAALRSELEQVKKERDELIGIKKLPYADQVTHLLAENSRLREYADASNKRASELSWFVMCEALNIGAIDAGDDDCPKPKEFGGSQAIMEKVFKAFAAAMRSRDDILHRSFCLKCGWVGVPKCEVLGNGTKLGYGCGNEACGYAVPEPKSATIAAANARAERAIEGLRRIVPRLDAMQRNPGCSSADHYQDNCLCKEMAGIESDISDLLRDLDAEGKEGS